MLVVQTLKFIKMSISIVLTISL